MKILVVFCHPRCASLTGAIADAFVEGASAAGHEIEVADLYGENFDPRQREADDPNWDDQIAMLADLSNDTQPWPTLKAPVRVCSGAING